MGSAAESGLLAPSFKPRLLSNRPPRVVSQGADELVVEEQAEDSLSEMPKAQALLHTSLRTRLRDIVELNCCRPMQHVPGAMIAARPLRARRHCARIAYVARKVR